MNPLEIARIASRRSFLKNVGGGLGMVALADLLQGAEAPNPLAPKKPHFAPKAKRVIYLFQSGAPSQLDLFDYKPKLADLRATELPDSIRQGQRLTGMTSSQTSFPVAPSR